MHEFMRNPARVGAITLLLAGVTGGFTGSQAQQPLRVLMTNDDGIEEVEARLLPVAEELRAFAEVTIVVSDQDRSGTSNMLAVNRRASLESRLEYRSEAGPGRYALEVHSVDGYPADCVILGVYGLLDEGTVDLVLSGPNGGPNLADGWFGSGTIGAARTAAFMGLPAVAVSGLDSDEPEQVAALARWVADLARSDAVREMPAGTYLTVGVPRLPPDRILGVRVARRARAFTGFSVERVAAMSTDDDPVSVWTVEAIVSGARVGPDEDLALYEDGWIVVTPMTVDEQGTRASGAWARLREALPEWSGR